MDEAKGPLTGFRVIDLSDGIAGAFCAKLLADSGADVVKVEPPGGDPTRQLGPFPDSGPHLERSALFLYLNTNKRSVVLDLDRAADRDSLLALVTDADAVVESFAPGRLASLGMGWDL